MEPPDQAAAPGPLFLETEQIKLLHHAACEIVAAAASGRPKSIADFPLGRLTEQPVVGVFVTLRQQQELRGCIGNFAHSTPLGTALQRAALGVVSHDPRFPPITADELPRLTVDLSVLHTRQLLGDTAPQRALQVVIGQHGLDIQYRGRTGLLLPRVAVDLGCDAVGFLQAVCRKAQLPEDTWEDPEAVVYRFSANCFGGPFAP